jgi:hypothetical protein
MPSLRLIDALYAQANHSSLFVSPAVSVRQFRYCWPHKDRQLYQNTLGTKMASDPQHGKQYMPMRLSRLPPGVYPHNGQAR